MKLPDDSRPPFCREISDSDLSIYAQAKRFTQRYKADPAFREMVKQDPRKAAQDYNISIDPEEIRPLWDGEARKKHYEQKIPMSPATELCLRLDRMEIEWTMRRRSGKSFANPNLRAWWERQVARNETEIGQVINAHNVHTPVCFELSSGCTVGCWFCGISAEKFKGVFEYTTENKNLWREVLEVVRDIVGVASQSGFCYWATEPFDNPEYEKFIADYHAVLGALPSTTTAMAHKDLPRARRLFQMWNDYEFTANRLSILTIKQLDCIHEEFGAEELVWTAMNFLNKGSLVKKATAGRALEKLSKLAADGDKHEMHQVQSELTQGTMACVSGFLFNMVEKTVMLISSCKADSTWPKGYRIYDQGTFTCGSDLRSLMKRMIADNMPIALRGNDKVKFRRDLQYKQLPNGFNLTTEFLSQNITNARYGRQFGDLIHDGSYTVDQIVGIISRLGATQEEVTSSIDALFNHGLLDEEPVALSEPTQEVKVKMILDRTQ